MPTKRKIRRSVPRLSSSIATARREGWKEWIRGTGDEMAVHNGCTFDIAAAERVGKFFRKFLCHSKGQFAGKPFELLAWQSSDVIYPLFGWKRSDGTRRFRIAYIELPKKNGKSTLASGLGIYLLAGDGEAGAEVFSAATDQEQASIVHGEAINMVDSSPALSGALRINRTNHNISYPQAKSFYRSLSSEAAGKEGLNASGIIADELHVWYGRSLFDTLRYAGRARRQPLFFAITTAGDDMTSVCREQHDYADLILKGHHQDERFFPYIRAAEPTDDINDPKVWAKANPSLGVTINTVDFKADIEEAKKSPSSLAAMKRYSFNLWTTSVNPWLDLNHWEKCKRDIHPADLEGRSCTAGLDLAKVCDMSALALLFPEADGFVVKPFFWLPESVIADASNVNSGMYRTWADAGLLELTSGNTVDYDFIERRIVEINGQYHIDDLAFDEFYARMLAQRLQDNHSIKVTEFRQTLVNFAPATARFEQLVSNGKMQHDGNPILSWHAGNVSVYRDSMNGNMRPVKPGGKNPKKIDGIVAAIMALGRTMVNAVENAPSVYQGRGLLVI